MATRRTFLKNSLLGAGALLLAPSIDLKSLNSSGLEISLAEWIKFTHIILK